MADQQSTKEDNERDNKCRNTIQSTTGGKCSRNNNNNNNNRKKKKQISLVTTKTNEGTVSVCQTDR